MKVYSLIRKKKIESLVKSLGLEDTDGIIIDTPDFEYDAEDKVFVSEELDSAVEGIRYGKSFIRAIADNLYSDSYNPSVVFSYSDAETAPLAYALAREYGIELSRLENITLENDMFYIAHSAMEIRNIISSRTGRLRTIVIFSFSGYDDMHALASAFQNVDILFLIRKGDEDEERLKKALDRVIFSPVVKRLSAVVDISSIDDVVSYLSPSDVVFEIELQSKEDKP